ncbi:hypothetical protein M0P25_04305 [archaeon]|jgi:hypothetical protein|nr:hypothetical protein [archaeon]MCK9439500.1 hypothetical protein [Patescibacteria group bacterium]
MIKRYGELKEFSVKCEKCNKEIKILEREKQFPLVEIIQMKLKKKYLKH